MSPEVFDKLMKGTVTELRLRPKWGPKQSPLIDLQDVPWALYNAARGMGLLSEE